MTGGANPRGWRRLESEVGATIVVLVLTMTALLSVVALAIDVGMLLTARTEAQRAADAAAMAGAGSLIVSPGDVARARDIAIQFGEMNDIHGELAEVEPEDVVVDLALGRVTVTVQRVAARNNPIPTWFARVFGRDVVDVAAVAAAAVGTTGSAICLKPWTIGDGWEDDGDGFYEVGEYYEAGVTSYGAQAGSDWRNQYNNGIDPDGTTYYKDYGRPISLKSGHPSETVESGWFYPWDIPQIDGGPSAGGDKYRWNIANCNPTIITMGDEYMVENGNMVGPTKQGVGMLIDQDPSAVWNLSTNQVEGSVYGDGWEQSPRIVHMPLFDPTFPIEPGKKPIEFTNIVGLWLERLQGNTVIGRFMNVSGVPYAGGGEGGNLISVVYLVE